MEKIIIGKNLLEKLDQLIDIKMFSKVVILTDKNVAKHWLMIIKRSFNKAVVIIIKPGEKEKNIKTVENIWKEMFKNRMDRRSILINLGGGVVCDMGGFAASIFMRGIDFINIPTTLLSMVDASVGGKTGIDFGEMKNGIGVFKNPIKTIIDINTLKTLPKRELIAAFGEIIKHGIISGREFFDLVTSKKPEEFSQDELIEIIKRSIKVKLKITNKDPEENGLRKVLNLGHTIGHAVESLSWKTDKPLLHGEAVAVGIVAECKLASSNLRGCTAVLSENNFKSIEKSIINAGLPTKVKDIKSDDIIKMILSDKKNNRETINWSLPKKIGKVAFNIKESNNLVIKAIKYILI